MPNPFKILIIGGGAAGYFAAIRAAECFPDARIKILEKTSHVLSKVRVSGGGRCNVTHQGLSPPEMSRNYPRGEKELKKAFKHFSVQDTMDWFAQKGVALKVEADHRVFPTSDMSQTIIDCFEQEARMRSIEVRTRHEAVGISPIAKGGFEVQLKRQSPEWADRLIITTGGSPKLEKLAWLADLGHEIVSPVPSLFTFNMPQNPVTEMMGLAVPQVRIRIPGSKLVAEGPLLITHWGMSAYAVLRLSAWGARVLHDQSYAFAIQVNWMPSWEEAGIREKFQEAQDAFPKRQLDNRNPFELPKRLWSYFLEKLGINPSKKWSELAKKERNRLVNLLHHDEYPVQGKTTFKEEFVTAGGISRKDIDWNTMQSKVCPGLFFAGEIIDMDGLTGGFNFQAAWTTGFIAGSHVGHMPA